MVNHTVPAGVLVAWAKLSGLSPVEWLVAIKLPLETVALADRNFNVPCESGIRYPTLIAMLNRRDLRWIPSVRPKCNVLLQI